MKIFSAKRVGVSKRFAAKAAMYRRLAKAMSRSKKFSYTHDDLIELYNYESRGITNGTSFETMRQRNGFAFGKWLRDIDVAQYKEDLMSGLINPIELLGGVGAVHNRELERYFNWRAWRDGFNVSKKETR